MVNAMNSVAFGNGVNFKANKPTPNEIAQLIKELGINMSDAQAKMRDARMSGYKLDSLDQVEQVVTGNFNNCIKPGVADIKPGTGFDTVSYMENNRKGVYQDFVAGKDKTHAPSSANDRLDIYA